MSKRDSVSLPRINLISLLAGALALASVFLPWWGLDAFGFGSSVSPRWTLWNGPSMDSIFRGSTQPYPTLTSASPIIGALVVISALLALAGSFTRNTRPLMGSFILSVLTRCRWNSDASRTGFPSNLPQDCPPNSEIVALTFHVHELSSSPSFETVLQAKSQVLTEEKPRSLDLALIHCLRNIRKP